MNRLILIFMFNILCAIISLKCFAESSLDHLVLRTNKGPVIIEMDNTGAPIHFDAITKLVELGVYNGQSFNYAQEGFYVQLGGEEFRNFGFYPEQLSLIKNLPNEITDFRHYRAAVTMPSSPEDELRGGAYIFTVMLDRSAELDKKQTIIGFVTHGLDILDETSKGSQKENLLEVPLKIYTANFMTRESAITYYKKFKDREFESDIFNFSKYSFLFIIFIQLILFYGKKKLDIQIIESIQIIVLLIATFSAMAQFYPLVGESTLASVIMVAAMLLCFKIMASLERSRGLFK